MHTLTLLLIPLSADTHLMDPTSLLGPPPLLCHHTTKVTATGVTLRPPVFLVLSSSLSFPLILSLIWPDRESLKGQEILRHSQRVEPNCSWSTRELPGVVEVVTGS